jgi:DNA topoisomerase-3
MGKSLFIAEKPSVGREFGKVLGDQLSNRDGYMEGEQIIVTWCVGHLVSMCLPDEYDDRYKRWNLADLPFIPETFKYQVIPSAAKQYGIVSGLMNRQDVSVIYVCTDSGREGEYIYRLVEQMAGTRGKERKRVWIDSQTEEEIRRGVQEAKDLSAYDHLADAAYLRAKSDYLMGINFSRMLTLKYGYALADAMNEKRCSISVGRVMTCVQGMVVRREREIRDFVKTPFYRVMAYAKLHGVELNLEWKAVAGSAYLNSPLLYKENGFKEKKDAIGLIALVSGASEAALQPDEDGRYPVSTQGKLTKVEKKKEKKNPPLLYNLAELQNDCSRFFKISPDETLAVVQELYEKKLVTYPRTDARVLSTAVAKEIHKNIAGLKSIPGVQPFAEEILEQKTYQGLAKTRYVNDKQITDHYAIIPTGQGIGGLGRLGSRAVRVYEVIVRRFLAIFYPPAVYEKINLTVALEGEYFFASDKYLKEEGYLKVMQYSFRRKKETGGASPVKETSGQPQQVTIPGEDETEEEENNVAIGEIISQIRKGDAVAFNGFGIREGETSPPKRYSSGSIILAMENAGQLIEDEELRSQIKGSGIGTSATRAEILKKLISDKYLNLNKKTQIITPTLRGELIHDIVRCSVQSLLNPELTASWEKGLNYVTEGQISSDEYMGKLVNFVTSRSSNIRQSDIKTFIRTRYQQIKPFYPKG